MIFQHKNSFSSLTLLLISTRNLTNSNFESSLRGKTKNYETNNHLWAMATPELPSESIISRTKYISIRKRDKTKKKKKKNSLEPLSQSRAITFLSPWHQLPPSPISARRTWWRTCCPRNNPCKGGPLEQACETCRIVYQLHLSS